MIRYFDASALAKRYVAESGSEEISNLLLDGIAVTCRLSETEIASALARRQREGRLTAAARDRLIAVMRRDLASLYVVEVSPEVSELACRLVIRHKLRAGDSLHLASAVLLSRRSELNMQFIAFDQALNEAARREGFALFPI